MMRQMTAAFLTAFAGLIPLQPAMTAYAAGTAPVTGSCGASLTWTYENGTLTVSGTGKMQNYDNPNEVPWQAYSDEITALKLEEGMTSVGYLSFMYLEHLTSVTIPESVTYIGGNAFFGCDALLDISIPASVSEIGGWAFDCTAWIKAKRAENPFVTVNGILIDGQSCTGEVVIPESVSSIGDAAFTNNSHMTAVTVPERVTRIGANAFARCSRLSGVTLPERLSYLGGWVFDDTPWLKAKCAESTLVIVNDLLADAHTCSGETEIPDGIRLLCGGAFELSGITAVTVPESVEVIDYRVFCQCRKLTAVNLPDHLREIGDYAFRDCGSLSEITIPESVTEIGSDVFSGCAEDFTISGWAGSRAESYAAENNIPFHALPPTGSRLTGDVNQDGSTDVSDAVILARFTAEDTTAVITAQGKKNADCNKNGKPDSEDVILILKAIAKLITL